MRTLLIALSLFIVVGCQHNPSESSAPSQVNTSPRGKRSSASIEGEGVRVARYLAWFEGDFQTDYQVNREIANSRLSELEGKNPNPNEPDNYLEYLSLLDAAGKHADAAKKLRAYLGANPDDKRAVFLLAVHYWRIQKRELATFMFSQLEKDATFPWKSLLLNNLGMLALNDKNRTVAISYFEKATKSQPSVAAPFVNLGALYLQSRSFTAAEPLFAKARALDGDFEDAAIGLAVALEGQGKFEESHNVYAEFSASHPTALSVVYNDSLLLGNRLARKDEAAQQMLRYVQRGGKETARAQEFIQSWR